MKVLQVGKYYDPFRGGIETVLKNLSEGLSLHADVQVLVSNTRPKTVYEHMNVPVTRVASLGVVLSSPLAPSFPYWMNALPSDIIHIHMPSPLAEISYLLNGRNKAMVAHFHSDIVRQRAALLVYRRFLINFLKKARLIIVPTPNHVAVSPFISAFKEKCRIVPYGINLNDYELSSEEKKKVEIMKQGRNPTIMFVGRLVYYKGIDVLIKAMADVAATLWIVGTGPLRQELEKLSQKLKLTDKVIFKDNVSPRELVQRYHACDMLVLPSVAMSEMFGVVQLEAMACRKPVVATNLPTGVSWVNQHEITGLLVPPKDPGALAGAINRLIKDKQHSGKMGEAGRKRVEALFTVEKMIQGVLDVYREVLGD